MNIEKSLNRLGWRLSQGKSFVPNENDINSYNEIVDYCNKKEKQQLVDNQLFGKLYIYLYGQFVKHYRTGPLDSIPQKELHRILDKDLRELVKEVLEDLNLSEMENCIKDKKGFEPMEYQEVSENFRIMVNAALNTFK